MLLFCAVCQKNATNEQKFSVSEQEALAILTVIKRIRHFLLREKLTIFSVVEAPRTASRKAELNRRLIHWMNLIALYEFEIRYLAEKENIMADYLSRCMESPLKPRPSMNLTIAQWLQGGSSKPNGKVDASIQLQTVYGVR